MTPRTRELHGLHNHHLVSHCHCSLLKWPSSFVTHMASSSSFSFFLFLTPHLFFLFLPPPFSSYSPSASFPLLTPLVALPQWFTVRSNIPTHCTPKWTRTGSVIGPSDLARQISLPQFTCSDQKHTKYTLFLLQITCLLTL